MSPTATTKKDNAAKPAVKKVELTPIQRLESIVLGSIERPVRGTPCLVGPTQWGKTKFLRDLFINKLGIPAENVVMFNPQNDLPEDIGGWPYRDVKNYLMFTQPANIPPHLIDPSNFDSDGQPKAKFGIIMDEIDKAQETVLSCLLTFFNPDERRLRTTIIPQSVPIVAAMNEPDARVMPDPLLARMLFLAFPPVGFDVSERDHLRPVAKIARELYGKLPEVSFPARPTAPGSAHKLVSWLDHKHFWTDDQFRADVVRGLFPQKEATFWLQRLQDRTPSPTKTWAESATPHDVAESLLELMNTANYEERTELMDALIGRAKDQDPTKELGLVLSTFFDNQEVLIRVGVPEQAAEAQRIFMEALTKAQKHAGVAQTASRK